MELSHGIILDIGLALHRWLRGTVTNTKLYNLLPIFNCSGRLSIKNEDSRVIVFLVQALVLNSVSIFGMDPFLGAVMKRRRHISACSADSMTLSVVILLPRSSSSSSSSLLELSSLESARELEGGGARRRERDEAAAAARVVPVDGLDRLAAAASAPPERLEELRLPPLPPLTRWFPAIVREEGSRWGEIPVLVKG